MNRGAAKPADRFGRLVERSDGADFPYYDSSDPLHLPTWKWVLVLIACAVSFTVLTVFPQPNDFAALVPRFLFAAIPFAVFVAFSRKGWAALFKRLRWIDLGTMVLYWLLTFTVAATIDIVSRSVFGTSSNPANDDIVTSGAGNLVAFYLGTAVQIFGEEIFTILPFLAVMYWTYSKMGASRLVAIVVAWLVTAFLFGAAHLPTYDWHFFQALVGVGVARLILTLAYIRTKNILVSTGSHILDDFSLFTFTLIVT